MGEKTGFMAVLMLFVLVILPLLFNMITGQVKSSKLLSLSDEVNQLVIAEGDITPTVMDTVNRFESKGVEIVFQDVDGNIITSSPGIGKKVNIFYGYDGYKTSNSVILTKR